MKWIIAIAASVVLNAVLILWGRGSFLAATIPLGTSLWIGLPLLILSGVFCSIAARRNRVRFMNVCAGGIAVALVIFSTLLSLPLGKRVLAHDLRRARTFCESLIPQLEQSKAENGNYPRDIRGMLGGRRPPSLLGSSFYQSDGTSFTFIISDPGTIMGGVEFNSQTKGWHHWD